MINAEFISLFTQVNYSGLHDIDVRAGAALLTMYMIFSLLVIAIVAWFWMDSLRARERALAACARACAERNVQLLDQTVALSRLSLKRHPQGRVRLWRVYVFEYSTDGVDRRQGRATLFGPVVASVEIGPTGMHRNLLH
jgi:hypothetical protein